ncbi:hypothetical protein [Nocardia yamanashiensis]|uniref:hypothetical protein n=1 Tax=Nocardia yamanashiensis TaxID=209247 RepID=UPI00082F720B|nr:hypothetical protein [Nocardia yamanashiensis]
MNTATAAPLAPWDRGGHFQPGDSVTLISFYATGYSDLPCTVVSDGLVLIRGSVHQNPVRVHPWPQHVRHSDGCPPCQAYTTGVRLLGARGETDFLAQWSPAAHTRFDALTDAIDDGTFTTGADVPDWLRTATAGLLMFPEAGGLQLARVYDPVDWPTLLDQHPGEVTVGIGDTGYGPAELTWDMVVAAYRALETAGYTPCLDVDLALDYDATLQIQPTILYCDCDDTALRARVSTLLGGIEYLADADWYGGWAWC